MLNPIRHFRYGPETNSSYTNVLVIPPGATPRPFRGAVRLKSPGAFDYDTDDPNTVTWFFYCVAYGLQVEDLFLKKLREQGISVVPAKTPPCSDSDFHLDCNLEGSPEDLASYLADLCKFALDNRLRVAGVGDWALDPDQEAFTDTILPFSGYVWKNGNYYIILFGTERSKVRIAFHNEELKPEYPELLDVKITDRCNLGCPWCAEASTPDGPHASEEMVHEFLSRVHPGVEVTIGGGDPLLYPGLWALTRELKFVSVTVRDRDFILGRIPTEAIRSHVRFGISLSPDKDPNELLGELVSSSTDEEWRDFIRALGLAWATVHWIYGVNPVAQLKEIIERHYARCILILGYKSLGRGARFVPYFPEINFEEIKELARKNNVTLAFDQLAIEQLGLQEYVLDQPLLYGGAEGEYSFFVDFVERLAYASSSRDGSFVALPEAPYLGWERDTFQTIRDRMKGKHRVRLLTLLRSSESEECSVDDVNRFRRAIEDLLLGSHRLVELYVRGKLYRLERLIVDANNPAVVKLVWKGNPQIEGPTAEVAVNGTILTVPASLIKEVKH